MPLSACSFRDAYNVQWSSAGLCTLQRRESICSSSSASAVYRAMSANTDQILIDRYELVVLPARRICPSERKEKRKEARKKRGGSGCEGVNNRKGVKRYEIYPKDENGGD